MTTLNLIAIWVSLFEVLAGIGVLVWCSRRDDPRRRALWAAVAALSSVYVVGYVWLIAGADVVQWSNTFRLVSWLAWPVWSVPAFVVTRQHLNDLKAVRDELS